MFVEFLGLPASGKSTLAQACLRQLKLDGVYAEPSVKLDDLDRLRKGFLWNHAILRTLIRLEDAFDDYGDFLTLINHISNGQKTAAVMLRAEVLRYVIHKHNPSHFDMIVSEEGILHRGIYLINKTKSEAFDTVDQYCELMPSIHGVVYLEMSAEASYQRALDRLAARSEKSPSSSDVIRRIDKHHGDLAAFQRRHALAERAVVRLAERGCPVVRISAEHELETAVRTAVSGLKNMLEVRHPPEKVRIT